MHSKQTYSPIKTRQHFFTVDNEYSKNKSPYQAKWETIIKLRRQSTLSRVHNNAYHSNVPHFKNKAISLIGNTFDNGSLHINGVKLHSNNDVHKIRSQSRFTLYNSKINQFSPDKNRMPEYLIVHPIIFKKLKKFLCIQPKAVPQQKINGNSLSILRPNRQIKL